MDTDKDLGKTFESRIRVRRGYGATGDLDKEFRHGFSAIELPPDPFNPRNPR
jgi:hypothetical protein